MKKTKDKPIKNCEKDAIKFIEILETADGGCSYCIINLLEQFIKKFPQHKELAEKRIQKIKRDLEGAEKVNKNINKK